MSHEYQGFAASHISFHDRTCQRHWQSQSLSHLPLTRLTNVSVPSQRPVVAVWVSSSSDGSHALRFRIGGSLLANWSAFSNNTFTCWHVRLQLHWTTIPMSLGNVYLAIGFYTCSLFSISQRCLGLSAHMRFNSQGIPNPHLSGLWQQIVSLKGGGFHFLKKGERVLSNLLSYDSGQGSTDR